MTEKTPVNVFSCLGTFNGQPAAFTDGKHLYPLIQFTIDTKNEELIPVRSSDISTHSFSKLNRIKNSKYFLAERFEDESYWKTCLLSINKDQVETLRIISGPLPIILNQINTYLILKDGLSIIEVNEKRSISVFRSVVHHEEGKKTLKYST